VNRIKMFNNERIIYFIDLIIVTEHYFSFFLNAALLNVYKLWDRFYSDFKLTYLKFQYQIAKILLTVKTLREHANNLSIILFIIIIIDHTRFDVDFNRFMREHLCRICMREKSLKRRKIFLYASSERSQWVNYSTYYVYFLLYLWLLFLLS
jgi:hypothetical protein